MSRTVGIMILALCTVGCGETAGGDEADAGDAGPEPAIGCGSGCPEGTAYADTVRQAPASASPDDRLRAVNGVRGGGDSQGGTDVLSLGLDAGDAVVLAWSGSRVTNGPGVDFVVFENAFAIAGSAGRFMDATVVEVSRDAETWVAFPHDYRAEDERAYSNDAADWVGFAGISPVRYHEETNPVDPFEAAAGGDGFDLDTLTGDDAEVIKTNGFSFLRLSAAAGRVNPDTGELFPREPVATGPDIDGVYARYLRVE